MAASSSPASPSMRNPASEPSPISVPETLVAARKSKTSATPVPQKTRSSGVPTALRSIQGAEIPSEPRPLGSGPPARWVTFNGAVGSPPDLVHAALQSFAERGLFRAFSRTSPKAFKMLWHRDREFELILDEKQRTLTFPCVLPEVK